MISQMTLQLAQTFPQDIHKDMQKELNNLDHTYQNLKKELLDTNSQEEILQAMKENLEMQLQIIQYYISFIQNQNASLPNT